MDNDTISRTLSVLGDTAEAFTSPHTLDEGLKLIVNMTCKLLDTTQAAVLLLDEGKQRFVVQAATGLEDAANVRVGFPLVVPERLQKILLKLQHIHSVNWLDAGLEGVQFPIISIPLYYKGNRIGLLFAGGARNPDTANEPMRRQLFSLLAPFASLILENAHATDILKQRFVSNTRLHMEAVLKEGPSDALVVAAVPPTKDAVILPQQTTRLPAAEQLVATSLRNPSKLVRILTESFYQELVAAGFDDSQVTIAATHLIDCIIYKGKPPKED